MYTNPFTLISINLFIYNHWYRYYTKHESIKFVSTVFIVFGFGLEFFFISFFFNQPFIYVRSVAMTPLLFLRLVICAFSLFFPGETCHRSISFTDLFTASLWFGFFVYIMFFQLHRFQLWIYFLCYACFRLKLHFSL